MLQSSLFVWDVDANIHPSCIDYLYFPVRREKYLFDGPAPRRSKYKMTTSLTHSQLQLL